MSTPDDRTRRLDPASPPPGAAPGATAYERESGEGTDVRTALNDVDDRLRSLRNLLAVVGVLAAIGVGLAVWALLEGEDSDNGRGDLRERVQRLDSRVDDLRRDVRRAGEESDVRELEGQVDEARQDASAAREAASQAADANDELQGQVQELTEANQELADRVEGLDSGGGDTGGAESP